MNRLEFTKCLIENQAGKYLIRLLLHKQSDLVLLSLSIPLFGMQLMFKIWNIYSKTCENSHSKMDKTKILMTNGSLMKVGSIAECSNWSILQYF